MSKPYTQFADLWREVEPPPEGTLSRTLHQDERLTPLPGRRERRFGAARAHAEGGPAGVRLDEAPGDRHARPCCLTASPCCGCMARPGLWAGGGVAFLPSGARR